MKKKNLYPITVQKVRVSNGNPDDIQYIDTDVKLKDQKSLPTFRGLIQSIIGSSKKVDLMYKEYEDKQ